MAHTLLGMQPHQAPPEYISVRSAAELLRVTPQTIRRYIRAGRIRATRSSPLGDFAVLRADVETVR